MPNIAEQSMLLRAPSEVPAGLKLMAREFQAGWTFVSGDAGQVEKKIRTGGWSFVKIADPSTRSGVGESSQEAIASALRLALCHIGEHFNAVEVEHIELKQYPWFFLARIRIYPCCIRQKWGLPVPDEAAPVPIASSQRRLPLHSAAMHLTL